MLRRNKDEEAASPTKNAYKIRAFTSAIKVISQLEHPIRSASEAKALKGVGPGIYRRIQEFFETPVHRPDDVDPAEVEEAKRKREARVNLEQIPGIGPVKANALVSAGCMSLEQLKTTPKYMDMLKTAGQRAGVTYFDHLNERVSREEAERVAQFIRDALPSKYEVILGGSYRRDASTSSDIDIIIFHPDHVHVPAPTGTPLTVSTAASKGPKRSLPMPSLLRTEVIVALKSRGLLAATLSSGELKWQGIALLPERDSWGDRQRRLDAIAKEEGVYRRLDLNLVAEKSRGAALVCLTGDAEFVRDIHKRASKVRMHLNEYGLWRWNHRDWGDGPEEGAPGGFWELVRAETEEQVMQELGMEYVEPEKRNFALVTGKALNGRGKKSRL
ncbi:hypothetical protein FB45DRAFT_783427 [Roridomyces roridus]|uniref:DNA polymerase n=1 Tax=Roridomyces roridus TaxID=1738132 RepID=A0AAD7FUA7_9AGAR|nr:hypothetical protein FB45DRAFT_783427 [Roridomyces roridus]